MLADRYRLGSAVGHGAMGQVHLAEDVRLARPVAIKSLRPELARHPDVRQRFGHEARAAARISHPNVVRVYDSGEHNDIPYLVMECLPGTSLVDELAWGALEPRRVRRIGLDVLGALDAAHRLGVVHRDVKPGNILLSAALEGPVKVSDFGIAKIGDDKSVSDSDGLEGTPAYLAPERVAGEPAGPGSDLYSLGVVLYESLAGRRPYQAETSLAIALAIHMGEGTDLLELRPDLDPALAAIITKALARDPSERWESAAAMAEELRAWRPRITGRGVEAAPETAVAGTNVAAVAAGGTLGAHTGPQHRTLPPSDADGDQPTDRRRTGILCAGAAGLLLVVLIGLAALRSPGRAEPDPPPPAIDSLAEAPSLTPLPETSVPGPPPSLATQGKPTARTTTTTRPARQIRNQATTTTPPPPRRPTTTAAPARVTTTKPPLTILPTTVPPTTTPPTTAAP